MTGPAGPSGPISGAARLVLWTYPPSFRDRYLAELAAMLEDTGSGPRIVADLVAGSVRAWARPSFVGDPAERVRRRRLATVSTVWVCWCAVFLASAALLRALEDPPPPGFDPNRAGWGIVHNAIAGGLVVGWLLVLAVSAPMGLRALRRRPAVRRAVVPPLVLLGCCVLLFVPLQVYATRHWVGQGRVASASEIPPWWAVLGLVWLLAMGIDAVWGTVALAVALRRAGLDPAGLRVPVAAAAALVVPMAAVVVLLVLVAMAGAHPSAAGAFAPLVYLAVGGLLAVLGVAAVSAVRGLRAAPST